MKLPFNTTFPSYIFRCVALCCVLAANAHATPFSKVDVLITLTGLVDAAGGNKQMAMAHDMASLAVIRNFESSFKQAGLDAKVSNFGSVKITENDENKTFTISTTNSNISSDIANSKAVNRSVLVIRVGSFQTISADGAITSLHKPYRQSTPPRNYNHKWSGNVSWSIRLLDTTTWTPSNDTALVEKETELMNFSTQDCSADQYKTCSKRLVDAVISLLRKDELLK